MPDTSKPVATIGMPIEQVGQDGQGRAVQGLRVPFTTAKGVAGTVFIPGTAVDHDRIVAAVRERALALDKVEGFTVA